MFSDHYHQRLRSRRIKFTLNFTFITCGTDTLIHVLRVHLIDGRRGDFLLLKVKRDNGNSVCVQNVLRLFVTFRMEWQGKIIPFILYCSKVRGNICSIQTRMTSKLHSSSDSYFLFEIHHDFIDTNSTVSYN